MFYLLSGCASPAAYQEPIIKFQQASTILIESARTEYKSANRMARNALIDENSEKKADIDIAKLRDSGVISSEDLDVRLNALNALSKHGQLLLALSSSDAPEKAAEAAKSLNSSIVSLNHSIDNLRSAQPSGNIDQAAGAFSKLAALVTKDVLNNKISTALDGAINSSSKPVSALIILIEDDMRALSVKRQKVISAARVRAVDGYRESLNKGADQIKKSVSELKAAEDNWDNNLLVSPTPGLEAMRDAHSQLVDYAKSSKKPQDLSELVDAVDAFSQRVTIVAEAVKAAKAYRE
jgi:hypothetical protein